MTVTYLVKGYLQSTDKDRRILYVGHSAIDAFSYFDNYSLQSEMEIQIWESGQLVRTLNQKSYK